MLKVTSSYLSIGNHYQCEPKKIWEIITDTKKWPEWGPTVVHVESSDQFIRLGSRGRVKTAAGIWLPFHINQFQEDIFWGWKIGPVQATGHRVMPHKEKGSILWFDTPIFAAPYAMVCKYALDRIERMLG